MWVISGSGCSPFYFLSCLPWLQRLTQKRQQSKHVSPFSSSKDKSFSYKELLLPCMLHYSGSHDCHGPISRLLRRELREESLNWHRRNEHLSQLSLQDVRLMSRPSSSSSALSTCLVSERSLILEKSSLEQSGPQRTFITGWTLPE